MKFLGHVKKVEMEILIKDIVKIILDMDKSEGMYDTETIIEKRSLPTMSRRL